MDRRIPADIPHMVPSHHHSLNRHINSTVVYSTLRVDHWIPGRRGGYVFFKKFVQQIVQKKFVLTTHEKKLKVQQTDGMFHSRGGGDILFGSTREKNLFGLGNEKN